MLYKYISVYIDKYNLCCLQLLYKSFKKMQVSYFWSCQNFCCTSETRLLIRYHCKCWKICYWGISIDLGGGGILPHLRLSDVLVYYKVVWPFIWHKHNQLLLGSACFLYLQFIFRHYFFLSLSHLGFCFSNIWRCCFAIYIFT